MTSLGTWIDTETPEHPWARTHGACGNDAPLLDVVSSPVQGWQHTQEPWEEETFPTDDGDEYNDWDESWQQYPAKEYDDWEEEADLEKFLAGESD